MNNQSCNVPTPYLSTYLYFYQFVVSLKHELEIAMKKQQAEVTAVTVAAIAEQQRQALSPSPKQQGRMSPTTHTQTGLKMENGVIMPTDASTLNSRGSPSPRSQVLVSSFSSSPRSTTE